MSYQRIPLQAGLPFRLDIPGKLLLIDSPGVAGGVDVALIHNGSAGITMPNRLGGFRILDRFDGVILTAAVATIVTFFVSMENVDLGTNQLEISNSPDNPVNVLFAGTVNPVFGVATIDNTNAEAIPVKSQALSVIVDLAPVAIGLGVTSLSNDATLRRLRIRNTSLAANVCIGGAAVAMTSPMILSPGEIYFEDDAAGAHLYAIADAAGATLQLQGLK